MSKEFIMHMEEIHNAWTLLLLSDITTRRNGAVGLLLSLLREKLHLSTRQTLKLQQVSSGTVTNESLWMLWIDPVIKKAPCWPSISDDSIFFLVHDRKREKADALLVIYYHWNEVCWLQFMAICYMVGLVAVLRYELIWMRILQCEQIVRKERQVRSIKQLTR